MLSKVIDAIREALILFDKFWIYLGSWFHESTDYPLPPFREVKDLPPPEIVTRAEWGAREPQDDVEDLEVPVTAVVFHHTNTEGCQSKEECIKIVKMIQDRHMDSCEWEDIGYNFLIGGDARVYEGRGWNKVGSHTDQWNEKSIGVAVIGEYHEEPPSDEMLETIDALINLGLKGYKYIREDYSAVGHNQMDIVFNNYTCTCPGDAFYDEIKDMPHWTMGQELIEAKVPEPHEVDSAVETDVYYTSDYNTDVDYPKGYDESLYGPNDPWNI